MSFQLRDCEPINMKPQQKTKTEKLTPLNEIYFPNTASFIQGDKGDNKGPLGVTAGWLAHCRLAGPISKSSDLFLGCLKLKCDLPRSC